MFEKMKEDRIQGIDFFSLARKFWKEQIFFYFLTSLSCIGSFVVTQNLKQFNLFAKQRIVFLNYSKDFSENFHEVKNLYLKLILLGLFLYSMIVFVHVWFAYHLETKVREHLKRLIVQKMFKLDGFHDKQKVSFLLNYSVKVFSRNVFFIPNQLFYVFADALFIIVSQFSKKIEWDGSITLLFLEYFFSFLFFCIFSQLILYKLQLSYDGLIENEIKNEIFLVENRDLIIKKNESPRFLETYDKSLRDSFKTAIARNSSETFSFVIPSYLLVKAFPFVCAYYAGNLTATNVSLIYSLNGVLDNTRKLIERGRDFPFYYSSAQKINEFLFEKERDDKQNEQILSEQIRNIEFRNVSFTYQNEKNIQKEVLKDFSIFFEIGEINRMNFPNGFGKSTIINLMTGMLKPQEGEIIVNESFNLGNFDMNWWRSNVSYSEHRNLISRIDLSTGQRQLMDLDNAFSNENRQLFIFDEADSNLDYKNRNKFLEKLKELSTKKIVVLVSHHTPS